MHQLCQPFVHSILCVFSHSALSLVWRLIHNFRVVSLFRENRWNTNCSTSIGPPESRINSITVLLYATLMRRNNVRFLTSLDLWEFTHQYCFVVYRYTRNWKEKARRRGCENRTVFIRHRRRTHWTPFFATVCAPIQCCPLNYSISQPILHFTFNYTQCIPA